MAAVNRPEDRSLKELLDGLLLSQKRDIKAFSGGHLNESKLWKPKDKTTHKSWRSAKKDKLTLVPRNRYIQTRHDSKDNDPMGEILANFSLGTSGTIPLPSITKTPEQGTRGPLKLKRTSGSAESQCSQGSYSKKDDGILVEELKLPELMLKNPNPSPAVSMDSKMKSPREHIFNKTPRTIDTSRFDPKTQFLRGFQEGVTKKDQFAKLKYFESEVLKVQDAKEKHVLTGIKAVEKLETKLKQDLISLSMKEQPADSAVSFQRLQAYSDSFESLIGSTPTFSEVLSQIKKEYDHYISHLLALRPEKHETLQNQMEQLAARRSSHPRILRFESDRVLQLEQEAKLALNENEMLRKELQKELELVVETVQEEPRNTTPLSKERPNLDLGDQIEELHAALLEKLDSINQLRIKLKTDYVPTSVCNHLEQCVKETEVDAQRLTSQKEFFEKNITEMEAELQELIETADTTDKDSRRVWNKINAVNTISHDGGQIVFGYDSESETDEEVKWNWYIS